MMQGANQFGGFWTEIKLEVVVDYLKLYTKALKPQGFRLWYIDAFAGSGEREEVRRERGLLGQPDEIRKEVFDDSAKLALAVQPPFDGLIFIEKQKRRCAALEALRLQYPGRD